MSLSHSFCCAEFQPLKHFHVELM